MFEMREEEMKDLKEFERMNGSKEERLFILRHHFFENAICSARAKANRLAWSATCLVL
jgi:hypothetical protein